MAATVHELGDEYIRRISTFIRTNEARLAEAGFHRRRRRPPPPTSSNAFNPLSWFASDPSSTSAPRPPPLAYSTDIHRLFYILMRLEALSFDVGSLDVKVDSPSRPLCYINVLSDTDKAETMSLSSIRSSLSAVSRLSLGVGLWGRPEPPSADQDLKYILSSFTKIPAVSLHAPGPEKIAELSNDPPSENALPLDVFKNLQSLECLDIDPRALLGWDRLADSLWSLTIKRSGLDDVSDIFIGAVLDDQARRAGDITSQRRKVGHGPTRQTSFYSSPLPEAITEDTEEGENPTAENVSQPLPLPSSDSSPDGPQLPSGKWGFLRFLSLSDNALTFIPTSPLPYLTSLTHLDLSSNLLVSVPSGLSQLYNLVSLNLSDNMIDSVLGIYKHLGQVLRLDLSHNRLDSLCGLERLMALERVDVRHNLLEDTGEIGRLSTLPNVSEVSVEGNPFIEIEDNYRVKCFDFFWKEGKSILLDGTSPRFYEKSQLSVQPNQQMTTRRPLSKPYSPPIIPVGGVAATVPTPRHKGAGASSSSSPILSQSGSTHSGSPYTPPVVAKQKKRKVKRIVDFDGEGHTSRARSSSPATRNGAATGHARVALAADPIVKDFVAAPPVRSHSPPPVPDSEVTPKPSTVASKTGSVRRPKTRHQRSHTDVIPRPKSPPSISLPPGSSSTTPPPPSALNTMLSRNGPGHSSLRVKGNKSATRRARAAASVFEPPGSCDGAGESEGEERGRSVAEGMKEAEAFRARIETLRADMGEGWLKVFSQSGMGQAGVRSG